MKSGRAPGARCAPIELLPRAAGGFLEAPWEKPKVWFYPFIFKHDETAITKMIFQSCQVYS